jgi:exodeoxyribonuclease VII small subunit
MPNTETTTFTESSQALTAIVDKFRNQSLPLEEALALFEQGIGYVRTCQSTLGNAKGKLQTLNQALAAVQTTETPPANEQLITAISPEGVATVVSSVTSTIQGCYTWQHQQTLANTNVVVDEAWMKQLLLALKASLPFPTQGLPKLYERENQSGLEAFLPLANGWLMVSVWRTKPTQQGIVQLHLQVAEAATLTTDLFNPQGLVAALEAILA